MTKEPEETIGAWYRTKGIKLDLKVNDLVFQVETKKGTQYFIRCKRITMWHGKITLVGIERNSGKTISLSGKNKLLRVYKKSSRRWLF